MSIDGPAAGRAPARPDRPAAALARPPAPRAAAAAEAAVKGRDVLAVLPTGYGKSAIYKVVAAARPGPTVVVSPLIALQRDQVVGLEGEDVGGAVQIDSSVATPPAPRRSPRCDRRPRVRVPRSRAARPRGHARGPGGGPAVAVRRRRGPLRQRVGPRLRPDYRGLGHVVDALGHPVVIALTATAAPPVRTDIVDRLHMRDPDVVIEGFERPESCSRSNASPTADAKDRAWSSGPPPAGPGAPASSTWHPPAGRRPAEEITAAGPPRPHTTPGCARPAGTRSTTASSTVRPGRRGDHGVRHGHRQARRALRAPRRRPRVGRRLLPADRAGRARRRASRGGAVLPPRGPDPEPLPATARRPTGPSRCSPCSRRRAAVRTRESRPGPTCRRGRSPRRSICSRTPAWWSLRPTTRSPRARGRLGRRRTGRPGAGRGRGGTGPARRHPRRDGAGAGRGAGLPLAVRADLSRPARRRRLRDAATAAWPGPSTPTRPAPSTSDRRARRGAARPAPSGRGCP